MVRYLGFEIDGKKTLKGLKAAFGPQLWWGANPAVLLKYSTKLGHFDVTGIYHEDIDDARRSCFFHLQYHYPKTRRATLHIEREFGPVGLEVGGIWGGQPLNGENFSNC